MSRINQVGKLIAGCGRLLGTVVNLGHPLLLHRRWVLPSVVAQWRCRPGHHEQAVGIVLLVKGEKICVLQTYRIVKRRAHVPERIRIVLIVIRAICRIAHNVSTITHNHWGSVAVAR